MRAASVFVVLCALVVTTSARAAVFTVDDPGEASDADTGDGVCATAGVACTLRAAIEQANALPGTAHTIHLPAGTFEQGVSLPGITQDVTITGVGAAATIIRSSDAGHPRLFLVPTDGALALVGVTLTNATNGPGSAVYAIGGAVTLTDCVVTGNAGGAVKGDVLSTVAPAPSLTITGTTFSGNTGGAAVGASNYSLAVDGCTFDQNQQPNYGGAMAITGTGAGRSHTIAHSTFSTNTGSAGGGLYVAVPDNTPVTVDDCTFSGNSGSGGGGAVYNLTSGVQITDSSFSGNHSASGNGGAILSPQTAFACRGCTFDGNTAGGTGGAVCASRNVFVDCTFSANVSSSFGGAIYVDNPALVNALRAGNVTVVGNTAATGGGIYGGGPNVVVKNSLVGLNTAASGPDCGGTITSQGYNLVGDGTGCGLVATTGDQVGTGAAPVAPGVGGLADNGGPTKTVALLAGSSAIDRGNPAGCSDFASPTPVVLTADQRGSARPADGDGAGGATCDIGAYEVPDASATTTTATTSPSTSSTATTSSSTTTTVPPVCEGGVTISRARLEVQRAAAPAGDEGLMLSGTLDFTPGTPSAFAPAITGAQILIEDLGDGGMAIFELSHRTTPIPGGPGCARRDGWKGGHYTNRSDRLDLPGCSAGSAHGLRSLRFKDRRAKGQGIVFAAVARPTTLGTPIGPFRVTLATGASSIASVVGDCGTYAFATMECRSKRTTLRCRQR